jgi:hypothetical protein
VIVRTATAFFFSNSSVALSDSRLADLTGPAPEQTSISTDEFVGFILLFVRHAAMMLQRLGYSGPVLLETTLRSIRNIPWLMGWHRAVNGFKGSQIDDEFRFELLKTTEELQGKYEATVTELLRQIFLSVNLVQAASKLQELIMVGYDFNQWDRPKTLHL